MWLGAWCRGGWKGRPIVALGCKDGAPLSMHPLLCAVSRPVRHARLAAALLRALVLMRHASLLVPLQQTGRGNGVLGGLNRSTRKRLRCAGTVVAPLHHMRSGPHDVAAG